MGVVGARGRRGTWYAWYMDNPPIRLTVQDDHRQHGNTPDAKEGNPCALRDLSRRHWWRYQKVYRRDQWKCVDWPLRVVSSWVERKDGLAQKKMGWNEKIGTRKQRETRWEGWETWPNDPINKSFCQNSEKQTKPLGGARGIMWTVSSPPRPFPQISQ